MTSATKIADLRGKSAKELGDLLLQLRKEQMNLRFQRATGQLAATARVRAVRHEIARIQTVLSEQRLSAVRGKTKQK